ncbi:UNVERIFIED_CONTAM: TadE-like protein [Acetivibrio alkalicellulosi]
MVKSEAGQSIVEFALVLPVAILLIFGIVDMGRLIVTHLHLEHNSQQVVRLAGWGDKSQEELEEFAQEIMSIGNPENLQVILEEKEGQPGDAGTYAVVTLNYNFKFITPFLSTAYGEHEVKSKSIIRVENNGG